MRPVLALARAALVGLGLLAVLGPARAEPFFTSTGSPFPSSGTVPLAPALVTPIGVLPALTLSNITLTAAVQAGPDQTFQYSTSLVADFLDAPGGSVVASFTATSTDLAVTLLNRSGFFDTGVFQAVLSAATFTGTLSNGTALLLQLNPSVATTGTATITGPVVQGGVQGLLVEVIFPAIAAQYSVNGGGLTDVTLTVDVPEPGTMALFGLAIAGLCAVRRRAA